MNLPFFASFIAFCLIIYLNIKRQNKSAKQKEKNFWERENQANSVRKKSLDNLNYIRIPLENFPTHLMREDETIMECITIMESLTSQKIVNLTGYSNTDLKLEYGTANITVLTEYDQNYTLFVRTLQKWADTLISGGYTEDASVLLEYAVSTNTDISRTYYQLADYYVSKGELPKIHDLVKTASNLRSSNRDIIIRHLKERYPEA